MNALHETFARASEWLWAALADHLWQATLFAALVCAVALLLRRGPARLRYALWLVASAKFVVPSALFAYLAAGAGLEASWLSARADEATAAGVPVIFQLAVPVSALGESGGTLQSAAHAGELYCALSVIWLLGCASLLAVWLKRRREFLRAAAEGREAYSGREFEAMERARRRLGLGRDVTLLLSPRGVEPGVWRTRRPVILLPESIAEHLDEEELESLMLHELVHVERRDNALSNFQMALACVFWFHPLVWFLSRRLLAEREQACDERVLEIGGGRGPYASSILKVVRFCFGWKVAGVSGAAAGSNLRRRIEKIMHEQKNPKAARWQRALPLGAATVALVFTAGAGLLSHVRGGAARAQDAPQVRARSGGGQGQRVKMRASARTQAGGGGPATQEILGAPESVVYFEHVADAPVVITDAKLKMITRDQLRRADDEDADYFDEEGKADFLVTLPTVTVTNVSGKEIKEVGIGFVKDGHVNVIMGYRAALKPGEAQTFHSEWNRRNMIMPGTFTDVSVKVVWATYTDGSAWGVFPRVPHPPQPPPPPPPGATFRRTPSAAVVQGDGGGAGGQPPIVALIEMGEGRGAAGGAGQGVGSGQGAGAGQGEGVGHGVGAEARGGGAIQAGDLRGKAISLTPPAYPAVARSARAQGTVTVNVAVDENGFVTAAEAVSGHPLLRSAAERAARAACFSPTLLSGKPVKVNGKISYNFVLSGDENEPEQ